MKRLILILLIFISFGVRAQKIEWKNIEEAEQILKAHPEKSLLIDVYTDWCGWCKKMDKTTLSDFSVVKKINDSYIPVKLNAESRKEYQFMGHKFNYVQIGRNGVNTLAYNLLQGEMSFPSYVILNKNGKITNIMRGYYSVNDFIAEL